ncbi:MAG: DNA gyrase C-terminal beta-propeller domain-containing protein [Gemmatimonadota bacterium]
MCRSFVARSETELLVFTANGLVKSVDVADLPVGTRSSRGTRLTELVDTNPDDAIIAVHPVPDTTDERFVLTISRQGLVKRTSLSEYGNVRGAGIRAAGLATDDRLLEVRLTDGTADVVLATRRGQMIRFDESEIRPMGRSARGVKGIELTEDDELVGCVCPRPDDDLFLVTVAGRTKRLPLTEVRRQGRAGKGLSVLPDREQAGDLVGIVSGEGDRPVVYETTSGTLINGRTGVSPTVARRDVAAPIRAPGRLEALVAVHPRVGGSAPSTSAASDVVPTPAPESRLGITEAAELAATGGTQQELGLDAGGS